MNLQLNVIHSKTLTNISTILLMLLIMSLSMSYPCLFQLNICPCAGDVVVALTHKFVSFTYLFIYLPDPIFFKIAFVTS